MSPEELHPSEMDYARNAYTDVGRKCMIVVTEHEMTPERSAHLGQNLIDHLKKALEKKSEIDIGARKITLDLGNIEHAGVYCVAAIMDFLSYTARETNCKDFVIKGIRGELRKVMEDYGVYEAIVHSNDYVRRKRKRFRKRAEKNKALMGSRIVAEYLFGKKGYKELGLESYFR
ncbi:MAG: hypothetical protein WCP89_00620 [archaeon]